MYRCGYVFNSVRKYKKEICIFKYFNIVININFVALDEFNLQCYVSMYAYILDIINNNLTTSPGK